MELFVSKKTAWAVSEGTSKNWIEIKNPRQRQRATDGIIVTVGQ